MQRTVSLTPYLTYRNQIHTDIIYGNLYRRIQSQHRKRGLSSLITSAPLWSYILYRVLQVLQGVEKLGGYAGFKKYIESPRGQKPSPVAVDSDHWKICDAWGWTAGAVVYTIVDIYADNHTGYGGSWRHDDGSTDVGTSTFQGNLSHAPWWKLLSAQNDFIVEYIGSGVGMEFRIDGVVAQFISGNVDDKLAVLKGGIMDWTWVPEE